MTIPTQSHTQQQRRALKILSVATSTVLLSLILSVRSHSAVTEVWVARYNNVVSNANGMSSKLVRDAAGDIIVAGYANDGVTGQDMLTIKYSGATGAEIWQQRYNGSANGNDVAEALVVDSSGNVVVAGYSFYGTDPNNGYSYFIYDYYVAKYAAADGTLLWERRYHDLDSINTTGVGVTGLTVDRTDNVVLAGTANTIKLAAVDGTLLWTNRYSDSAVVNPGSRIVAMALDRSGNVVVTGHSFSSSTYEDIYTVKYAAADGAVLWDRSYNGTNWEYSVDYASGLFLDSRGDVVVTGYNGNSYNGDGYLFKYSGANGAPILELQDHGRIGTVAFDNHDNIVIAGYITTGFKAWGWPVYTQNFMAKLAAGNGAVQWVIQSPLWPSMTFDQNGNLLARTLNQYARYAAANGALLASGEFPFTNTIAVGRWPVTWLLDGDNVVVTAGYFETAKYAAVTGTELWHQQFIGPINLPDYAAAVAVDGSGNVIVTGSSEGTGEFDYYTAKYAAKSGELIWEQRYKGPAAYDNSPAALVVDRDGNVVVTGSSYRRSGIYFHSDYYTAKYAAADGALIWEQRYEDPIHYGANPVGAAMDESGNVAVTGSSWDSEERRIQYTAKYAGADGALLWEIEYRDDVTGYHEPKALAMDGEGNVVTAGSGIVVKYAAADGHVIWKFNPLFNVFVQGMALDAQGNIVLTGSHATAYNEAEFYTAKHAAADGALLWEKRGTNLYGVDVGARAVAVDSDGNVVVTGSVGGNDCYTAKYAGADGTLIWEDYNELWDMAIAVADSGDVILAGTSGVYDGTFDYYTAKLSSTTGAVIWEKTYSGPANGQDFTRAAHPLALGPNGIVAVTGYSSAFTDPLIIFGSSSAYDMATVVYRETHPPVAVTTVSPRFDIWPDDTHLVILSPNGTDANVVLDGSHSSDADDDPLQFTWFADGQTDALATGAVATNQFVIGLHTVQLLVSDPYDAATAQIMFEVITPATAVGQLIDMVNEASLGSRNLQPLLATLNAAMSSFDRGELTAARKQLAAFQNKVRAQIELGNPALANQLIGVSQQITVTVTTR